MKYFKGANTETGHLTYENIPSHDKLVDLCKFHRFHDDSGTWWLLG